MGMSLLKSLRRISVLAHMPFPTSWCYRAQLAAAKKRSGPFNRKSSHRDAAKQAWNME